jgi:RNA polymerase sigma-70 factor, ECF subfamily
MADSVKSASDIQLYALLRSDAEREAAFAELYARYSSRVWLYCRRIVGDEALADDLFQDTFLRFLKSAAQEREMTNVPAYLLRIARNLCLNAKRDHKTTVALEDFHFQFEDRTAEHAELARLVAMALDLLPEDHKEALSLQTYGGLSYNEIAEIMGVPMTTVRNWIVRAKKKMREILSPYLADVPVRSQKMRGSI